MNMIHTFICSVVLWYRSLYSLQWCHNGRDGVSNHQPHACLLNRLLRRRSKKTTKARVTGFCLGNSPVTGEFPTQMASNAKNVSIWWRHHVAGYFTGTWSDHATTLLPIKQSLSPKNDNINKMHDDVIKWKHFLRYWPVVLGIHRSAVSSPHKGQWRGALIFSLICAWINDSVNNREAVTWNAIAPIMTSLWWKKQKIP